MFAGTVFLPTEASSTAERALVVSLSVSSMLCLTEGIIATLCQQHAQGVVATFEADCSF